MAGIYSDCSTREIIIIIISHALGFDSALATRSVQSVLILLTVKVGDAWLFLAFGSCYVSLSQPASLRGSMKWVSAYGLSNNNNGDGGCGR